MLKYLSAVEQDLRLLGAEQDLLPLNIRLSVCQMQPSFQILGAAGQK